MAGVSPLDAESPPAERRALVQNGGSARAKALVSGSCWHLPGSPCFTDWFQVCVSSAALLSALSLAVTLVFCLDTQGGAPEFRKLGQSQKSRMG